MSELKPPPNAPPPNGTAAPAWLPELQRDFSKALLAPLVCDGRSFLVAPSSRDAVVLQLRDGASASAHALSSSSPSNASTAPAATVAERVELYQRQYWMRLFSALQESFARVALHVGHFQFNQLALQHLQGNPPKSVDLADLAPEFANFLRRELPRRIPANSENKAAHPQRSLPNLLLQALAFDEAELKAFEAPWTHPWRPSPQQLAELPHKHVLIAPSFSLLREDWPLAERPFASQNSLDTAPSRFVTSRYWVYSRTQWSIALRLVEPAFARLLHAAQTQPLAHAVATLEQRLSATTRHTLTEKLPQWTQLALEQSWWLGVREVPSDTQ